ncbi:30S ribosomal protein S6e [Methanonatronarchaeum sp. AMET6-2]|uniref:30S ribosomal protein S6e n=1 Tax=Methanonatronarchaeum sp. AMET6-2 TaxID=2933293 RepID=UPI0012277E9C|nr:30S ribosomal protein S6e [Methanonatronarchaeum sp. AMET6-2]RZN61903.1 MAG: 30S ribosomal protein S6e [Methanonatronarchaeia archaeon]UOY10634.1 30S ribosomal protein S6e [Methanonatronarchaeum sp. AMET6-2]
MPEFKLVISNPENGETYQKEISGNEGNELIGKKIGENIQGETLGLTGYQLTITGGSDSDGIPMRKDIQGPARKKVLVSGGQGFNPTRDGERKRKTVRGSQVSEEITQINMKVSQKGDKDLQELLTPETEAE